MAIRSFVGLYAFLSNFYRPAIVHLDGVPYVSVEHAYQAAKTLDPKLRERFRGGITPAQAKRRGRTVPLRPDWEDVKIDVMRGLLMEKFAPASYLADKLRDTAPEELIEGNWWGDTFWGVCNGHGENWLGLLLMEIRNAR